MLIAVLLMSMSLLSDFKGDTPMQLVRSAIKNHLSDLQTLKDYSYEVDEQNKEFNLLGSVIRSWGGSYDVVIADGTLYRTIVDPKDESRRPITELPPVSMTQVTPFDPGIPFEEIPGLYEIAHTRDVFFENRPASLIRLTPRQHVLWPNRLNRYHILMFVDKGDQRIVKLVYSRWGETLTFDFAKTHGTWLIQRSVVENTRGSLLHRVRYRTEHTFRYKKFGVSTRITAPPPK